MNRRRLAVAVPALLAVACATPVAIERPEHPLELELRTFQAAQHVFRRQNTAPVVFDFPDQSRVTVRDVSLDGFPGNEYVRCRFHYQNRTPKPVVQSWVWLDVLDGQGNLVASEPCVCYIPYPVPIERGCYVADELRTRTFGAHLEQGWTWRIRCSSNPQQDEEPLVPPVAEPPLRLPPMIIKNRGQNDYVGGRGVRG